MAATISLAVLCAALIAALAWGFLLHVRALDHAYEEAAEERGQLLERIQRPEVRPLPTGTAFYEPPEPMPDDEISLVGNNDYSLPLSAAEAAEMEKVGTNDGTLPS